LPSRPALVDAPAVTQRRLARTPWLAGPPAVQTARPTTRTSTAASAAAAGRLATRRAGSAIDGQLAALRSGSELVSARSRLACGHFDRLVRKGAVAAAAT